MWTGMMGKTHNIEREKKDSEIDKYNDDKIDREESQNKIETKKIKMIWNN